MQQMLFCVTMVRSVSPSWVSETPRSSSSSCVNWHASQFATAVMVAVNSQAFMGSPSASSYAKNIKRLNQNAVAMVDLMLDNLGRPAGERLDPGLKLLILPLYLDDLISLAGTRTSQQGKTALLGIIGFRHFQDLRIEHGHV